VNFEILIRVSV